MVEKNAVSMHIYSLRNRFWNAWKCIQNTQQSQTFAFNIQKKNIFFTHRQIKVWVCMQNWTKIVIKDKDTGDKQFVFVIIIGLQFTYIRNSTWIGKLCWKLCQRNRRSLHSIVHSVLCEKNMDSTFDSFSFTHISKIWRKMIR